MTHILCIACPYIPGKPCKDIFDESNPDWALTVFPFATTSPKDVNRFARIVKRDELKKNVSPTSHESTVNNSVIIAQQLSYLIISSGCRRSQMKINTNYSF